MRHTLMFFLIGGILVPHVNALQKDSRTYEHETPDKGGMLVLVSDQEQEASSDVDPEVPPRVVGQGTQEELDALDVVENLQDPVQQIAEGHVFLETYPESGLTAYVHYVLSTAYRRQNDIESFLKHGEEALKELPDLPQVLAYQAFFNSERRQPLKARRAAVRALGILEDMVKPDYLSAREWASQKMSLVAEAKYALGRVYLSEAVRKKLAGAEDPTLKTSVGHFLDSIAANPEHQFSTYRLAEAYQRQKDYEASMKAYARSVAMGGPIGQMARERLEMIYKAVRKTKSASPANLMVSEQNSQIAADKAAKEAALDQIQVEADAAAAEAVSEIDEGVLEEVFP